MSDNPRRDLEEKGWKPNTGYKPDTQPAAPKPSVPKPPAGGGGGSKTTSK